MNVFAQHDEKIYDVLEAINEPEAHAVLNSVTAYSFFLLLHFWDGVLSHINRVQLRLQDHKVNFHEAAKDIKGLGECLQNMREDLTSEAVSQGQLVAEKLGVSEPRTSKKKMVPGETAHDETISPTICLHLKMKAVIDHLIAELKGRFERLENQGRNFGFLLDVKSL